MFEIKIVDTVEYRCEQSYQKKEEFITINAEFLYENESVCNGRLCFYKINEALGKIFFLDNFRVNLFLLHLLIESTTGQIKIGEQLIQFCREVMDGEISPDGIIVTNLSLIVLH